MSALGIRTIREVSVNSTISRWTVVLWGSCKDDRRLNGNMIACSPVSFNWSRQYMKHLQLVIISVIKKRVVLFRQVQKLVFKCLVERIMRANAQTVSYRLIPGCFLMSGPPSKGEETSTNSRCILIHSCQSCSITNCFHQHPKSQRFRAFFRGPYERQFQIQ